MALANIIINVIAEALSDGICEYFKEYRHCVPGEDTEHVRTRNTHTTGCRSRLWKKNAINMCCDSGVMQCNVIIAYLTMIRSGKSQII